MAFFNQYLLIGIIITVCVYGLYLILKQASSNNYLIALIIIGFLTLTSDIGETFRTVVNLISIVALFFIFIKKFALEFYLYPKLPSWMIVFISIVIISMVLSTIFSESIITGVVETSRQILFFILIYIIYAFTDSEKSVLIYIYAILIAGGVLSISIIYSFISSENLFYLLTTSGLVIDAGYFNNQAAAGGILVFSISFTFMLILSKECKIVQNKKKFLFFLLLQFISMLLTNSRAAISASIISVIFITFILNGELLKKIIMRVFFFLVGSLLLCPKLIDAFFIFFRAGRVLENTRYILWNTAFAMYSDHPIIGVGPGLFRNYMYKYLTIMLGSWEESHQIRLLYNESSSVGLTHNFFISKLTDLGILGLLSSFLLPILFFSSGVKLMKKMKIEKNNAYSTIVAIVGIGIGLFYRSFFEVTGLLSYGWITRDLPFWLMFTILLYYLMNPKVSISKLISS